MQIHKKTVILGAADVLRIYMWNSVWGGWEEEEKETRYGLFVKYLKKSSSSNNRIISPCKVLRTATPLKWWWEYCILIMSYKNTHIILCPQKKCFKTISNNNSNTTFRSKLRHIDSKNSYTRSSFSFTISMVSPCYKRPDWQDYISPGAPAPN